MSVGQESLKFGIKIQNSFEIQEKKPMKAQLYSQSQKTRSYKMLILISNTTIDMYSNIFRRRAILF